MTRKKQADSARTPAKRPSTPKVRQVLATIPDDAPTFAPKGLTPLEWRFAQEFIVDLNGSQAYQRASPECTEPAARANASRLLASANVAKEVQRLLDERAIRTGITADRVLVRLWNIATADVRKLVEYRIGSCRHCWGMYNQYHYTEAEFSAAQDKHIREEADRAKKDGAHEAKPFPEKGGPGYDHNRPPNPECPECWGRGQGMPIIHDTRHLDEGEAALFAGLKVTKDGLNVNIEDRAAYLQLVGRHLGMWNDKLKVTDETNPLMALIQQIQASHSTVPIVHDDPELVQDVTPKAKSGAGSKAPTAPGAVGKSAWRAAK
jgi:phage terminase small subunit